MTCWQSIETAPKDGTHILALGKGTYKCAWPADEEMPAMMVVIFWSWHTSDRDEPVGDGLFRKVPSRILEMWQPIGPHFFVPTHWMPLRMPLPPEPKLFVPLSKKAMPSTERSITFCTIEGKEAFRYGGAWDEMVPNDYATEAIAARDADVARSLAHHLRSLTPARS